MCEWSILWVVHPPTFLIYASSLLFSHYGTIAPLASFAFPSVILPPPSSPLFIGLGEMKTTTGTTLNNRANFFFAVTTFYNECSLKLRDAIAVKKKWILEISILVFKNSQQLCSIALYHFPASPKLLARGDAAAAQDCLFASSLNASNTSLRHYRARFVLNFRTRQV